MNSNALRRQPFTTPYNFDLDIHTSSTIDMLISAFQLFLLECKLKLSWLHGRRVMVFVESVPRHPFPAASYIMHSGRVTCILTETIAFVFS